MSGDKLPPSASVYPYGDHTADPSPLQIVGNWCTAGERNPIPLVKDYVAAVSAKRLAAIIKASWKVTATLAELETAAASYREQVLKQ